MSLYERLSHRVDLTLPGFERTVPAGRVSQLSFEARDPAEWFEEFVSRLRAAIGRRHLPVFRAYDGEFAFSVGHRPGHPPPGANPVLHYLREAASYLKWRRFDTHWSGLPSYGHERYRGAEWKRMRLLYAECLREISAEGILALGLFRTPDRFGHQYLRPICDWMDRNGIELDARNYYPFYFVYALLNGPRRGEILEGANILVATSFDGEKRDRLERGLEAAGARSVQFVRVSRSQALKDTVRLDTVRGPVDVALVAAGIGAANVLVQLRELGTLCLDAGYCLELLADPSLCGSRDYTLSDPPAFPATVSEP